MIIRKDTKKFVKITKNYAKILEINFDDILKYFKKLIYLL
jgi:cytoskeletal protein RodZ